MTSYWLMERLAADHRRQLLDDAARRRTAARRTLRSPWRRVERPAPIISVEARLAERRAAGEPASSLVPG
jgi:hypothetical protein